MADDIHGMDAAVGFLTARGGATSHAAVVARGMGKCCITGASGILVDEAAGVVRVGEHILKEGDWLSLDGSTGRVFLGKLRVRANDSATNEWLMKLLTWAKEASILAVRANADTPQDAERGRSAGAAGIGLCRTEHMFFAPDRLRHVRCDDTGVDSMRGANTPSTGCSRHNKLTSRIYFARCRVCQSPSGSSIHRWMNSCPPKWLRGTN